MQKKNLKICEWTGTICTAPDTKCTQWQGTFCKFDMYNNAEEIESEENK